MRLSTITILVTTLLVNVAIWVFINKPFHLVESHYPLNSLSFNPFKRYQNPFDLSYLTAAELESDIKVLAGKTRSVRIYSARNGQEQIPAIAKKYGLKVVATAFLDDDKDTNANALEVDGIIQMAKQNKNVTHVIIGNETQLHKTVSREELLGYIARARQELKVPVSTAEPWDFWLNNPEMATEVDFVAVHILPYWLEVPIDRAVDYVLEKYNTVKDRFPKQEVMIAETGWPSDGPQRGAAQATQANQALFVRDFIRRVELSKINYNIIEAFDQPWKGQTEGRVGEHWGIMDADRNDKFPIKGPVLEDPNWKYWALSSTILGFLASLLFLFRRPNLKKRGQAFSIIVFQILAGLITQLAREASDQYMSPGDIVFWSVMISAQVLLAIILLTDAAEIADVVGGKPLKNRFDPIQEAHPSYPFVSIHLACCREPPEMVIATIDSLARLDYPDFEVIVVDNNTLDASLWKPVEAHCKKLGDRFHFYSLGSWPGFKAGALNFALHATHPKAQVVGVVDADYIVEPNWLKAATPYFDDPTVGVVQAPQEHREWDTHIFRQMENDEYSGFFRIGMVQRNEVNAIIQHGTMTLIRRETLDRLKGWAEWCICEDSELGLRILLEGSQAIYLNHSFGHGLVPDSYEAYAKQRFRWAYGGMRIFRHYWREIFGLTGRLTRAQRYHFIKGWLPWIGDALHMVFTATALIWSAVLIVDPLHTDFPEPIFVYPALLLVALRLSGTLWTYAARVKISRKRTLLAMIAGGSLTHKVAKAVFQGLLGFQQPFYRTPKMDKAPRVIQGLRSVFEESALVFILTALAITMLMMFGTVNHQAVIWAIALVVQGFPYMAAVVAALVSSLVPQTASPA